VLAQHEVLYEVYRYVLDVLLTSFLVKSMRGSRLVLLILVEHVDEGLLDRLFI
jgi:hypothetical protein